MARDTERLERRWTTSVLATIAAALVYSWIAAGFRPFTWPMRVAVLVPVVLALVVSWNRPRNRIERARDRVAGLMVWVTLLVLLLAWELIALFQSPREDHPTLSSISDDIMSVHTGRAAMFAVWLAAGWVLFLKAREEAP
jgi:predicted PurR-regulated permease PerM